ncbi:MAG: ABC transporter ATP-binding protein [bacterium]
MVVAELIGISKKYRLQRHRANSLRDALHRLVRARLRRQDGTGAQERDFYALRDVSFKIEAGESLGVIGANGAGKSTVLKLLAGITEPSAGEVVVRGRTAALIEIGAGFHGDLSGRENIFLYGNIMGMRRREIQTKFDSIVQFAGLESFIDQPVKRYSSGMYARLGFSVVAHMNPELLLIDEVLAVGDVGFQRKCLQRMQELRRSGCALVFVSHNLAAVEAVCEKVLWLDQGRMVSQGATLQVLGDFRTDLSNKPSQRWKNSVFQNRSGSGEVRFTGVELHNHTGNLRTGNSVRVVATYYADQKIQNPTFALALFSDEGIRVFSTNTKVHGDGPVSIEGEGKLVCHLESLPLLPGNYFLRLSISDDQALVHYDYLPQALNFTVSSNPEISQRTHMDRSWGLVYLPTKWRFKNGAVD